MKPKREFVVAWTSIQRFEGTCTVKATSKAEARKLARDNSPYLEILGHEFVDTVKNSKFRVIGELDPKSEDE